MKKFKTIIKKKAIFFSIASLLLILLFLSTSEIKNKKLEKENEIEITRARIKILNSLISDLENVYFEKFLYISSKSIIIGLSHFYYDNNFDKNRYIKPFDVAFQDVLEDNVLIISDNPYNLSELTSNDLPNQPYIDMKYSYLGLKKEFEKEFEKINVEIKQLDMVIFPEGYVKQIDPWTLEINASFKYEIIDKNNIASWKGKTSKIVRIPVYGIYSYDLQGGKGKIDSTWYEDTNSDDEPSVLSKLSKVDVTRGNGLCKTNYCQE